MEKKKPKVDDEQEIEITPDDDEVESSDSRRDICLGCQQYEVLNDDGLCTICEDAGVKVD